ncbi:MAG: radical SAM protein [Nitrospiraceae bacterium]|nr:radical SAM protein [Nitrospiraceae bacterium]
MNTGNNMGKQMERHPCFSEKAHKKFSRLHVPVAPKCNIGCNYCVRKYDCVNESRPGVTSRVLTPAEAVERAQLAAERTGSLSVVGIAGPGDPLANEATFETLRLLKKELPELATCVSTNGLLLPDRLADLLSCGLKSLTITINALTSRTAEKIYAYVSYDGKKMLADRKAAERLLTAQWNGLRDAIDAGLPVKVNTLYIPGVNEDEIRHIAFQAANMGATIMNIMPLIPQGAFSSIKRPDCKMMDRMRDACRLHIPVMTHCKQCRADAFGLLGEDKDVELEVLNANIGEDYCDMVF